MLIQLAKFMLLAGVILLVAWMAGTGHVAYVMVMLDRCRACLRRSRPRRLRDREEEHAALGGSTQRPAPVRCPRVLVPVMTIPPGPRALAREGL